MNIESLGHFTPDETIPEWLVSAETVTNYFPDTPLRFVLQDIENDLHPAEFLSAMGNFLSLTAEHREEATPCIFQNYTDILEDVGEEDVDVSISSPSDVWQHLRPIAIYVGRRAFGNNEIYVAISANCEWEPEHGLQIVYRYGNQLSRVSQQDGHLTHSDAFGLPESEDRVC